MAKPEKKNKFGKQRPTPPKNEGEEESASGMRLNKYIAHCGICSRRKAATFIQGGLVTVNDQVVLEIGHRVQDEDKVTFRGKVVRPVTNRVYLLLNKPKDAITTVTDDRGRRTVMDLLDKKIKERIFPVGRLDRMTTGLLLLTNDGDLAKKLSHPSHEIKKIYHVVLNHPVSDEHIAQIQKGLILEDGPTPVDSVGHVRGKPKTEVGIEIHIGRNRIVRRIFKHLGYQVLRLDRVYYAGLTKKDLPRGKYRHLSEREIVMLKHFT